MIEQSKFYILKNTSDFLYIMGIRGVFVWNLLYLYTNERQGSKNKPLDVQNELDLHN